MESRLQEEALRGLEFRVKQKANELQIDQQANEQARTLRAQAYLRESSFKQRLAEDKAIRRDEQTQVDIKGQVLAEERARQGLQTLANEDRRYLAAKEEI